MSDRYFALTVILEDTIREDDAKYIMDAIGMIKGVARVEPLLADPQAYWARMEARRELERKVWNVFREVPE